PAAIPQAPQAAEVNNAAAPSAMNDIPMTGTIGTENAPPVTTPVPYSSSQVPGRRAVRSPRYSATVSSAPTKTAGANASQKRRAGPDSTGSAAARALRIIAHPPTASARNASATHTTVHPNGEG